jgi:hypothetical protein
MVDAFWDNIIKIEGMAVMTGFNACHDIVFDTKQKEGGYKYINKFCGYDLEWLTHRTSYKFTPKCDNIKIEADFNTTVS